MILDAMLASTALAFAYEVDNFDWKITI